MVFECATGEVPFADRGIFQVGLAHLQDPPPHPSDKHEAVPRAVGDAILTALAKEPEARPASATAYARSIIAADRRENGVTALIAKDGALAGQRFELEGERTIGREGADIEIDDDQASRRHARIDIRDGVVTVEDLGSTNGTFVNGTKIEALTPLPPGDTLKIGATTFALEAAAEAPAVTVSRPAAAAAASEATAARKLRQQQQLRPRQRRPAAPPAAAGRLRAAPAAPAPLVTAAAVGAPSDPFGAYLAPESAHHGGGIQSRRRAPQLITYAIVLGVAVALAIYFGVV